MEVQDHSFLRMTKHFTVIATWICHCGSRDLSLLRAHYINGSNFCITIRGRGSLPLTNQLIPYNPLRGGGQGGGIRSHQLIRHSERSETISANTTCGKHLTSNTRRDRFSTEARDDGLAHSSWLIPARLSCKLVSPQGTSTCVSL